MGKQRPQGVNPMKMKLFAVVVAVAAVLVFSGSMSAHHGTAAYDTSNPLTVKGSVTEFRFINPHCQVYFDDPKALAKPWTTTFDYQNRPDWELGEISCSGDYLDFSNFESFSFKKKDEAPK
jgi:hypothetical protein